MRKFTLIYFASVIVISIVTIHLGEFHRIKKQNSIMQDRQRELRAFLEAQKTDTNPLSNDPKRIEQYRKELLEIYEKHGK
jgi:anion-transporting  ArsA/GET3 family ATPase